MFTTALYCVKSPQNVGMIARTHVAFGGDLLVDIVNGEKPWTWNQRSAHWSRGLHRYTDTLSFSSFCSFLEWGHAQNRKIIAIEISNTSHHLPDYEFPERPIILVGNETVGIPPELLALCDDVVTIPQMGPMVGSLNVSTAAAIVMYEIIRRVPPGQRPAINGFAYDSPLSDLKTRRLALSHLDDVKDPLQTLFHPISEMASESRDPSCLCSLNSSDPESP